MCGIAGGRYKAFDRKALLETLRLAGLTRMRGYDGFGLVAQASGWSEEGNQPSARLVWKWRPEDGAAPDWFDLEQRLSALLGDEGVLVVMSSRAQPLPEADAREAHELQPYVSECGRWVLVHNGTISNDRELWARYAPADEQHPGIDTRVVMKMLEVDDELAYDELVGGFAFAVIDSFEGSLELLKNTKTLWVSRRRDGSFAFASEAEWLVEVCGAAELSWPTLEALPPRSRFAGNGVMPLTNPVWSSTPDLDPKKAVVVTSGGIDSITSAYVAAKLHGMDVTLLHFPHGQLAEQPELLAVREIAAREGWDCKVIPLKELGELGNSPLTDSSIKLPLGMRSAESTLCWTPGRNMLMVAYAAAYAEGVGAAWVYYGNNMEEEATAYGDNDLDFVVWFNRLLQYGCLKPPTIRRSLARLMKPEILVVGQALGVPYDLTWSCDRGLLSKSHPGKATMESVLSIRPLQRHMYQPCGECGCCTTRRYAFKRAGIEDPQTYVHPLPSEYPWADAKEYDLRALLTRLG